MTVTRRFSWFSSVVAGLVIFIALALVWLWPLASDWLVEYLASQPVACRRMSSTVAAERQPIKNVVSARLGGIERFEYQSSFPGMGTVHPHVAIMAWDGWLLGGDQGEFGGGIVFERPGHPQVHLSEVNVEDFFQMPFGFVATTRYTHLSDDVGSLVLITMENGVPTASKLYDLPSATQTSWLLESDDLLINTSRGSMILGTDRSLTPVKCLPTGETDA